MVFGRVEGLADGCVDGRCVGRVDGCVEGRVAGLVEGCADLFGRSGRVLGRVFSCFQLPLLSRDMMLPLRSVYTLFGLFDGLADTFRLLVPGLEALAIRLFVVDLTPFERFLYTFRELYLPFAYPEA